MLAAFVAIAAGGLLLSRVTRGGGAGGGVEYREALVSSQHPFALNPLLAHADPGAHDLSRLTHRALLRLDDRAVPVPDIAGTLGVSGDGLAYRFTIAAGRRWSDGTPIAPQDVSATVAAVQQPGFPDAALATAWKGVAVRVAPDNSVTMTLGAARASFASTVADLPLVPAAVASRPLAEMIRRAAEAVPASGPMMVRDAAADRVTLDPNPSAPRAAHLHEIEIRIVGSFDAALAAFGAGQVDAVEATTPAQRSMLAQVPGAHVYDSISFRFVDMLFNAHRPGLDDPAVRRAIASAVDRHALIAAALQGDARAQVDAIPAGVRWLGPQSSEQPDPLLAQRALDAAGWRVAIPDRVRSKNGAQLAFTMSVPDAEPLPAVAHVLTTQLEAIGVGVTVRPVAPESFASDTLGQLSFDLAVADWDNGPDPDVSSFWRSNATPPAGFNVSGLPADPFLDQALDGLATERDQQVRQDAANRVNQRLADDAPAAFLYAPQVSFVVNGSIQGVHVPAAGTSGSRYEGFTDWSR